VSPGRGTPFADFREHRDKPEIGMDSLNTQTLALVIALAVILIGVVGWLAYSQHQSKRLRERFGPEYDATVKRLGSKAKAEAELKRREKRVANLEIVALAPADVTRFSQAWARLQGSFVDDPKGVLIEADRLVRELLLKRGYPVADFDLRAADISVGHPERPSASCRSTSAARPARKTFARQSCTSARCSTNCWARPRHAIA
jgi:hypothetical protein